MEGWEEIIHVASDKWEVIFLYLFKILYDIRDNQAKNLNEIKKVIDEHSEALIEHKTRFEYLKKN
jgi:hypothetical protein